MDICPNNQVPQPGRADTQMINTFAFYSLLLTLQYFFLGLFTDVAILGYIFYVNVSFSYLYPQGKRQNSAQYKCIKIGMDGWSEEKRESKEGEKEHDRKERERV